MKVTVAVVAYNATGGFLKIGMKYKEAETLTFRNISTLRQNS